ncbi:MAG: GHMP kinase [Methanobacterium sp.]|nr:GHMP kinase [Methanobacterium sp.]
MFNTIQLHDWLLEAQKQKALPKVIAYNRIDGPGSSLDLNEFQQTFWKLPDIPYKDDPTRKWTHNLPRTIGITIDTGTQIEAHPFHPDLIGVRSVDYDTEVTAHPGEVVPVSGNWLLKIIEIFNLKGVMFLLKNLSEGIHSSGLGGSSTATIGVCILANELAGRPFTNIQLISLAARIEQGLGLSITGTQEQSNVLFGGVTDYVWFPWGRPGHPGTGYGESLRYELIPQADYGLLEERMAIFHTGEHRQSADVNTVWMNALLNKTGYKLHSQKMKIAYAYREALRLKKWDIVLDSIEKYRKIRIKLCEGYMESSWDLLERAKRFGSTVFPLGAGGGGGVLLFSPNPESLENLRSDLKGVYREIPFKIRSKGHEISNVKL